LVVPSDKLVDMLGFKLVHNGQFAFSNHVSEHGLFIIVTLTLFPKVG